MNPLCDICIDDPPKDAVIRIIGLNCCRDCFDALAPNLSTEALERMLPVCTNKNPYTGVIEND